MSSIRVSEEGVVGRAFSIPSDVAIVRFAQSRLLCMRIKDSMLRLFIVLRQRKLHKKRILSVNPDPSHGSVSRFDFRIIRKVRKIVQLAVFWPSGAGLAHIRL
jgi:hypothetical protein